MIRQLAAHHDPAVLASPHLSAALAVHRAVPVLSLGELLERASSCGEASQALLHVRDCADCRLDALCSAGELLAREIGQRRSRQRPAA